MNGTRFSHKRGLFFNQITPNVGSATTFTSLPELPPPELRVVGKYFSTQGVFEWYKYKSDGTSFGLNEGLTISLFYTFCKKISSNVLQCYSSKVKSSSELATMK